MMAMIVMMVFCQHCYSISSFALHSSSYTVKKYGTDKVKAKSDRSHDEHEFRILHT